MLPPPDRCPACGYPVTAPPACARCSGTVRSPRDGRPPRASPSGPVRDLIDGFLSLFVGALSLLHDRAYVGKLTLPLLANLATLLLAFFGIFFGLRGVFDWLLTADWGFLEFVHTSARWVASVAALVLAAISLWLLAPVLIETVTSPFLDPIAEATERAWAGEPMPAVDPGFWRSTVAGLRDSARVLLLQLALLVPLLLLSLTGIGALVAAVVAGWLNAVVWFDIPCARRGYGLAERRALLRRNWARALGFGLAFQIAMFIPPFNILLLTPAAAVATSALYFRFDKRPALASGGRRATVPGSADPTA